MYDPETKFGILNDFDLASLINVGETSPRVMGHRRTGTKAFMALELLRDAGVSGQIHRLYRHELEAFAWVLLYAAAMTKEESKHIDPFASWHNSSYTDVYKAKASLLSHDFGNLGRNYVPDGYEAGDAVVETLRQWSNLLMVSVNELSTKEVRQSTGVKFREITKSDTELIEQVLLPWGELTQSKDWIYATALQQIAEVGRG